MSRQKEAVTKKRGQKMNQKQARRVDLSKTSRNQKALSSTIILKANENLAQECDRELLEDFANQEN